MSTREILNNQTLAKLLACIEHDNTARAARIVYRMAQALEEREDKDDESPGHPNRYKPAMVFAMKSLPIMKLAVVMDATVGEPLFLKQALEREREFLAEKDKPTFLADCYDEDHPEKLPIVLDSPVGETWEQLVESASKEDNGCKFTCRVDKENLTIWAHCSEHGHTIKSVFRPYKEEEFLVLDPLAV